MVLNVFEEKPISNRRLPLEWQSQSSLDELNHFLQANWEQRSAFYQDGQSHSKQQFLSFLGQKSIRANNYIGTIVFKGQQLNIFPKMFQAFRDENETSELDLSHMLKNIIRWIEYCTKFDYPYIKISSDFDDANDLRELFITLYVRYVHNALSRGLFYRYEDQTEDCSSIKGKMDINDYFLNKYPNGHLDKFRCTYSNFEFDNTLNRIIKHTCMSLLNESSKANQKLIRNILMKLNEVSDMKCTPSDCDKIRLSRMHNHYGVILSMSKMFLLNQTSNYNVDDSESFCFLFPTELLFEGFIGGFMKSMLHGRADVNLQASDTSLVDEIVIGDTTYDGGFVLRNDMFVQMKDGRCFVLDTKYKQLDRIENSKDSRASLIKQVSIDDLRQVREYAYKRGLKEAYLLYPIYRFEDMEETQEALLKGHINIDGKSQQINVRVVRLPFIFEEDISKTKNNLTRVLEKIFA